MRGEETELNKKSFAIQSEVEGIFLNVFTIADAYQSFVTENPDLSLEESEEFLKHLLSHEERYVRNIAYIEDTTIKYNYPFEENSSSIGIDLSLVAGQSEDILYIKDTFDSLFTGPVDLVQGGKAFILRTPIIVDGSYHGQISTVIDADQLISLLEEQADANDVEIEIGYTSGEAFIHIGEKFSTRTVTSTISNNHMELQLTIYELSATAINTANTVKFGTRVVAVLTILIVCYYVYRNGNLINEVKFKANHDSLTGSYNRTKFVGDYENGSLIGKLIAFMDINKFKILNDTLGHHFGDWALIKITEEFMNSGDFRTYRISGDEFILVSRKPMEEESFLNYINLFETEYYNPELRQKIEITLSVGVIENIHAGLGLETMLIYLDYAMYDAKKQKSTYTLVDETLMKKYNEQKIQEQLLIEDITNNNLHVFYQPIIDIEKKCIDSIEVLSRWEYKNQLVSAGQFIDIVKRIKYIELVDRNLFNKLQVDYEVITKECKNYNHISFAVNLSAEILKDFEKDASKFNDYVKELVIPKEKMVFEISEDINLGVISNETIDYISAQGYNLIIDDFGSGVSKLSDVLSGKLAAIKTDKSMLPKNKDDMKRLQGFNTIIKAVNSTGSTVCVEGVETYEQLELSKDAGCRVLQGFLFGKPMSLDDIIHYINTFDFNDYII